MANTFIPVPDFNGTQVNQASATDGSTYHYPAWQLALNNGGTPVLVAQAQPVPVRISDGSFWLSDAATPQRYALSTTVQTLKGSAGRLRGWTVFNPNPTEAYIQVFDVSGTVTLGSPTFTIPIAPYSGSNFPISFGIIFANAIKVAATTTATGSTAPTTAIETNFFYT